jgi:hypothetical protein
MLFFSPISKFFQLPAADRVFLLEVMLVVWAVRLMLWLLPFRQVRQLLTTLSGAPGSNAVQEIPVEHVAWAVDRASRYVPAASCLTQALAAKLMLGHLGHQAIVRIGVARSDAGDIQAHAWVESGGRVVIGGSGRSLRRYTRLAASHEELW